MRVVLDENVSRGVSQSLAAMGISVLPGLPQGTDDGSVFQFIVKERAVLITRDYDFTNPIRFAVEKTQGIIYIHRGNLASTQEIALVVNFLKKHSASEFKGKLVTLYPDSVRIR